MEPERLLQKLLMLSEFLILAGIISIYVSFGSVCQFLFDYHHDSLISIHPRVQVIKDAVRRIVKRFPHGKGNQDFVSAAIQTALQLVGSFYGGTCSGGDHH